MFASRARRIGVAIGLVAVAAVVAVVALGSGDSDDGPDRATIAANRLCKTAIQEIAQATRQYGDAFEKGNTNPLARKMFDAAGELQAQLGGLAVPEDEFKEMVELKDRVFETEEPILDLIAIPPKKRVPTDARELESLESEAKSVASSLGFDECARLSFRVPPLAS
jgi:type II secretory pathway pseudopilin PulG